MSPEDVPRLLQGKIFQNVYMCAKCGYELFSSRSKHEHLSPWPAFTGTIHDDSVAKWPQHNQPDAFTTVSCGKCGHGLGHEFLNDGPKRGQSRLRIFSSSLKSIPKGNKSASQGK
ncbi:methionine-R-sulfoxide reductase B1-like [Echinops telfairi]|uniref:Methionine-R-sulfoxide reductase B1-like n=1 Tax=Echinops telfairi TaxID=9371 RepID=A0AC55CHZ0_ECHTE|nr:methionine-R-sulfoxide reductase B1-like [Echinops telfairi]